METQKGKALTVLKIEGNIIADTFLDFERSLSKLNRPEYQLNLNSVGGRTLATLQIIDLMEKPISPKCTISYGENKVGSAALYIFLHGEQRFCGLKTIFHIHRHYEESTGIIYPDISKEEMFFYNLVSEKTNLSLEQVINLAMAKNGQGTTFKAYEALEWGIVHKMT